MRLVTNEKQSTYLIGPSGIVMCYLDQTILLRLFGETRAHAAIHGGNMYCNFEVHRFTVCTCRWNMIECCLLWDEFHVFWSTSGYFVFHFETTQY